MESLIRHVLIGGLLSREASSNDELDFDDAVDIVDSLIPILIEALDEKALGMSQGLEERVKNEQPASNS